MHGGAHATDWTLLLLVLSLLGLGWSLGVYHGARAWREGWQRARQEGLL